MGNWDNVTEDELDAFIKENKDKFSLFRPSFNHNEHFLNKLHNKFKKIVNIIPYLLRVALATVIIFVLSIWLWNSYIRWDRKYITLPHKMENTYHKVFHNGK